MAEREASLRETFDSQWLTNKAPKPTYTKFRHRPVEEIDGMREQILAGLKAAFCDHHCHIRQVAECLDDLGFKATAAHLAQQLPSDHRTRMGNFGEVVASEHLRQRHGYDMPVFKLRYRDHLEMTMRGEDVVAFLRDGDSITTVCYGEAKAIERYSSRTVEDAHSRLRVIYEKLPGTLRLMATVLRDKGDHSFARAVEHVMRESAWQTYPSHNWILLVTGNAPRDPFAVIEEGNDVLEELSCVDLALDDLVSLVNEVHDNPLPEGWPDAGTGS